ncbi:MAG TPA: succinate dehydrogenase/fumarate reductase iron-sulfur subunit [Baekduia sp.]|nr:succinate dehydrogenase/fumarate reductase iron-sulfur subunit [Baekduia sp.]
MAATQSDNTQSTEPTAQEYTLRIRRYNPETGDAPFWDEHTIELEPHRSVLEGILQAKDLFDGSIGIRCSCRAAICGSCGVRINGQPGLACQTHLDTALARGDGSGVIEVEPMGNMPVIKDLIVDMDAVHWKKVQRVTPWLINKEPIPEREYIVPRESMIDITQSMACIQCGACVSDCLSMEADPLFVGPAALAKAYRFVGDPRDDQQYERLKDLAEDAHGIYDCTHCFKCIEACPKGVAPMNQIMRLRRRAGGDHHINDRNNGDRHERTITSLIRDYGLLHEGEMLPRSYGGDSWFGKFHPAAAQELLGSLPVITKALMRRKVTPMKALLGHKIPKDDLADVKKIYKRVEGRDERIEFNLYISGVDEDDEQIRNEPVAEVAPGKEGSSR